MSKPNARKVPGALIGTGINIEGEDDLEFCLRKAEREPGGCGEGTSGELFANLAGYT